MKEIFYWNDEEYIHHEFEATGTRYQLHEMKDRFGGWLIIWTSGQQCWRLFKDGELKFLFGKYNYYDGLNIAEYFGVKLN
jgi:hypothetical protein